MLNGNGNGNGHRTVGRVAVKKLIGFNTMTPEQFVALDKATRKELILAGKVLFFDQAGNRMGLKESLEALRHHA